MDKINVLAEKSRAGNKDAFGELYDILFPKIYRFIYYRSFRRSAAEDVTSTVFLKCLERMNSFDPDKGTFTAWLYGIARNCLKDYYREKMLSVQSVKSIDSADIRDGWDIPDGKDALADAENRMIWESLKPSLQKLSHEEREIIMLRIWDDLPYKEIARILNKTTGACKMSFSRSISILRKEASAVMVLTVFTMIKDLL